MKAQYAHQPSGRVRNVDGNAIFNKLKNGLLFKGWKTDERIRQERIDKLTRMKDVIEKGIALMGGTKGEMRKGEDFRSMKKKFNEDTQKAKKEVECYTFTSVLVGILPAIEMITGWHHDNIITHGVIDLTISAAVTYLAGKISVRVKVVDKIARHMNPAYDVLTKWKDEITTEQSLKILNKRSDVLHAQIVWTKGDL